MPGRIPGILFPAPPRTKKHSAAVALRPGDRRDSPCRLRLSASFPSRARSFRRAPLPSAVAVRRSIRPSTMLRALRFDGAHRPERVEGRLSKGNPKSAIVPPFPPRAPSQRPRMNEVNPRDLLPRDSFSPRRSAVERAPLLRRMPRLPTCGWDFACPCCRWSPSGRNFTRRSPLGRAEEGRNTPWSLACFTSLYVGTVYGVGRPRTKKKSAGGI